MSGQRQATGLIQRTEQSLEQLSLGLSQLYGLLRAERRARSLLGDVTALHQRCVLEEKLLRSRLGLNSTPQRQLPVTGFHSDNLAVICKSVIAAMLLDCRELEGHFAFFKLGNVAEFYHKVRFELLDIQRSCQRLLLDQDDGGDFPRRRAAAEPEKTIVVAGRVREALRACPLYFILDSSLCSYRDPVKLGFDVVRAGVRILQLRLGKLSTREFIDTAMRLKQMCSERDCILIINDRLDVALLSGADGIHIGAEDPTITEVRKHAPFLLVGMTVRRSKDALEAQQAGADYLGCGSVFESATKPGLPLIGVRGIKRIAAAVSIPVVGVGGITLETAPEVLRAGAAGVCSVSPFRQQRSVRGLVAQFRALHEPSSAG